MKNKNDGTATINAKDFNAPGLFYDKNKQSCIILTKEKPGKPTLLRTVIHYTQFQRIAIMDITQNRIIN